MSRESVPVNLSAENVAQIDPRAVYRRNPQVRVRNVAGTLVLRSGDRLLELDREAAHLWRGLDGLAPFNELHCLLTTGRNEPSVDRGRALKLLAELVDAGVVLVGPGLQVLHSGHR